MAHSHSAVCVHTSMATSQPYWRKPDAGIKGLCGKKGELLGAKDRAQGLGASLAYMRKPASQHPKERRREEGDGGKGRESREAKRVQRKREKERIRKTWLPGKGQIFNLPYANSKFPGGIWVRESGDTKRPIN